LKSNKIATKPNQCSGTIEFNYYKRRLFVKIKSLVSLLAVIILASPFTASAKEKTKPKAKAAEDTKLNELTIGMSKCSQVGIPLVRLKCFDELAGRGIKDTIKKGEPVVSVNGKWNVSVTPDPVDDIKTVTLSLVSEDNRRVGMIIRCKSDQTTFYIDWDTGLETYKNIVNGNLSTPVLSRIGKEEAVKSNWPLSADKQAIFHPDNPPISFIKKLISNDTYLAQVTRSYNPNPFTAVFDIKGLGNAIKPLMETCHWE
jgi:type VI secretion system protein VasI